MTGLVACPDADMPDESSSREFQLQGKRIALLHNGTVGTFDNESPMPNRGAAVLNALAEQAPASLDWWASCCHGWTQGIQAGFDLRGSTHGLLVSQLVIALARVAKESLIIPLYSCSTANDPVNGFAASLSRGLAQAGTAHRLFAHEHAGHCTRNPYVRTWTEHGGGDWLIAPGSPRWSSWVTKLHDLSGTLDVTYPWLSPDELDAVLAG